MVTDIKKIMTERFIQRRPWFFPLLLFVLTLLVYSNSFPGAFILDDLPIVQFNFHVHNPDLITIFRSDYWNAKNTGLYRPLTILSLAINYNVFGPQALGFHLVNVLLHAGVAVLLWRLLSLWGLPALACGLASILFVIHPIHAEVVNEVVGRSELLVALFLLAAFIVAQRSGILASLTVCLLYLLALLSKEHAIIFLALLPIQESFVARSFRNWQQRWPRYAGLLLISALWLLWREAGGVIRLLPYYGPSEYSAPLAFVNTPTRILSALQLQGIYLWKQLVPADLQAYYALSDLPALITEIFSVRGMLVFVGTVLVVTLLFYGWRRNRTLALLGVLYLVSFAPTANVFLPIGVTMAERLAYFPSLWFCAAIGYLATLALLQQASRHYVYGVIVIFLLSLSGVTLWRNPVFASNIAIWRAEVAGNKRDDFALTCLAESYAGNGQILDAENAFNELLSNAPEYRTGMNARSNFLINTGRYLEARDSAQRSLALATRQNNPLGMAVAHIDLAKSYLGLGEPTKALDFLSPQDDILKNQQIFLVLRGTALAALGRDEEAVDCFARIYLGFDRFLYGQSLFRLGRLKESREQLELVVKNNGNGQVWNLLGVVSSQQGDLSAALVAFEKAVKSEPDSATYRKNLDWARYDAQRRKNKIRPGE